MRRAVVSKSITLLISLSLIVSSPALANSRSANPRTLFLPQTGRVSPQSGQPGERAWPRGYRTATEAQIVLHQPQIASWENQKHIVAYAAVSYVPKAAPKPELGTIKLEADTNVSLEKRLVKFSPIKIIEVNFPTLSKDQTREIVTELENVIPDEDRMIALDRVLTNLNKSENGRGSAFTRRWNI